MTSARVRSASEWPVARGRWPVAIDDVGPLATGHREASLRDRSPTTLVIGLGNPLRGDDGIGPAVIEALRLEGSGLTLVESAGDDLMDWLASDEFDRIIIVDAAEVGQAPGGWVRLTTDRLAATKGGLCHGLGLVEALDLVEALGMLPPPITAFAVQPAAVGWGPGLSLEALRAVDAVASAIRDELAHPDREGQYSGQTRKSVACSAGAG